MSESNVAVIQPNKGLVHKVAERYGVDPDKLLPALKNTAFKQGQGKEISNDQMMALMIVANQYGLNPFTKEIFAYPDKGGIVPVVSVDGWSRIINENPQMDGIEFEYSPETVQFKNKTCHVWIDCIIYRKDRSKPIRVREFFDEVKRELSYASPWDTHPNRMHRHKAEIQCARIAFGFAGIYDQDEAERIMENSKAEPVVAAPVLEEYSQTQKEFFDNLVSHSDKIGMYLFSKSVDESTFTQLYHSFPKGQKGKFQQIVDNLLLEGSAKLRELAETVGEHCSREDEFGVRETLDGISDAAIENIMEQLDRDARKFTRWALDQIEGEEK